MRKYSKRINALGMAMIMAFSMMWTTQSVSAAEQALDKTEEENQTYLAVTDGEDAYARLIRSAKTENEQPKQLEDNFMAVLDLSDADADRMEHLQGVVSIEEDIAFTANEEVPIDEEALEELVANAEGVHISQWNMKAVKRTEDSGFSGDNIKVAILDSGISYADDIQVKDYIDLIDSENENLLFDDATGHGTSIAGIIASSGKKDGLYGIAQNADLYSVKILDANNETTLSKVIEGIYWCINHDMDVINMSFGTRHYSAALEKAIKDAENEGIIMVAAAGNNGAKAENLDYPAAFHNVIAVGASDGNNCMTEFTSEGDNLDILAPGEKVWSYGFLQGLAALDGTSIAAAHVTGAVALLLEKHPEADAAFIRQLLISSSGLANGCDDIGILNIENALTMSDDFVALEEEAAEPQEIEMETYDTSQIVSGSWSGGNHSNTVVGTGKLVYTAKAAGLTDKYYGTSSSHYPCSALHAHHNYVLAAHFLYKAARASSSDVEMKTVAGATTFINRITAQCSSDKTYGSKDLESIRRVVIDACSASNGMAAEIGISGDGNLKYMLLGIAAHVLGDTFAHRTMVPKAAQGGSASDAKTFKKTDFVNWTKFQARVADSVIEFRDIGHYMKAGLKNNYTDNISFYSDRYAAAKKGVANMIGNYQADKGFSITRFYTDGLGRNLNNFQAYAVSAGYSDNVSAFSTGKYRVDGSNDRDHVDYPSYVTAK